MTIGTYCNNQPIVKVPAGDYGLPDKMGDIWSWSEKKGVRRPAYPGKLDGCKIQINLHIQKLFQTSK